MSAAGRLNQIEARANAATKGPWGRWDYDIVRDVGHCTCGVPTGAYGHETGCGTEQVAQAAELDGDFIAHARSDVPALVAALRAVLEHVKEMEADIPHDGNNTAANHTGRLIRTAIEEALS